MPTNTPTTDRAAFLAAIRDRPGDDLPRLVFADWLEEHGEPDRAEFIRVQCELTALESAAFGPECSWGASCGCSQHERLRCLRKRQRQLWGQLGPQIIDPQITAALFGNDAVVCTPTYMANANAGVHVARGFVARVSGPLAAFWEERWCGRCHGRGTFEKHEHDYRCGRCRGTGRVSGPTPAFAALVARDPVPDDGVTVTDREPWSPEQSESGESDYCWWRESVWAEHREVDRNHLGNLPDDLFDAIADSHPLARMSWGGGRRNQHIGFHTRTAAAEALSRALVTLARG